MLSLPALALLLQSPQIPGPLQPMSAHVSLNRLSGVPLELRVTYPKQPGRYPLIVFSHGFRGSMNAYDPLIQAWVGNGYVCIQPNHADSLLYYKGRLVDLFRVGPRSFANWDERPQEVSMVLDRIKEIEAQVPGLAGRLDVSRAGVGGHSFGAHTSELVGGARPATGRSFKDPRFKPVLLISPQGTGGVFREGSFDGLTGPVLVITGSKDTSITPTTPEQRRQPFELPPPGDKYLLWTEGAHHGMGGISGRRFPTSGPNDPVLLHTVQAETLAFWNLYLKGDLSAKKILDNQWVARASKGASNLKRR